MFYDTNDKVSTCARALDIGMELVDKVLAHVRAKIGGVERDGSLKLMDEEHFCWIWFYEIRSLLG